MENEVNYLFSVVIWDKVDTQYEEPYAYAVIAEDIIKAGAIALKNHRDSTDSVETELDYDTTLSYEITCAPDGEGNLYDIVFNRQL